MDWLLMSVDELQQGVKLEELSRRAI